MMNPELGIDIAGIHHDPAIWVGAGPCTAKLSTLRRCIEAGAGAVDTKRTALPGLEVTQQGPYLRSIKKPGRTQSPYRWFFDQKTDDSELTGPFFYSLHHCEPNFLHFHTAQKLIRGIKAWSPQTPVYQNSCASKYMPGDNVEDWIKIGKAGQEAGADAYVMDFWVSGHFPPGFTLEDWAEEIFKPVIETLDIPVFYKMLPSFDFNQIISLCKVLEKVGVAALQPTEGPVLLPPCDVYNEGKPQFQVTSNHSVRTLTCGPWLRYLANTMVYLASENVNIPVMGIGGIMTARDAIERIMYGASAIGLCTAPLLKGYQVITEIKEGISQFMKAQKYHSIEDFRGLAKKHVVWDMYLDMELKPCIPKIDSSRCNGCGTCLLPVHCDAIKIEEEVAVCEEDECTGCGLCAQLCPQNAISIVAHKTR